MIYTNVSNMIEASFFTTDFFTASLLGFVDAWSMVQRENLVLSSLRVQVPFQAHDNYIVMLTVKTTLVSYLHTKFSSVPRTEKESTQKPLCKGWFLRFVIFICWNLGRLIR
jgi:hypothetical protein